jgi:hypothetical protein
MHKGLRRVAWCRGVGFSVAVVTVLCASESPAIIAILSSDTQVTGGTLLPGEPQTPTFSPDRLSFSVAGDYSFTADSTSVTMTIETWLLTTTQHGNPQGPFNVNTSIDGFFASDLIGTTAEITGYSASSFLFNTFVGVNPVPIPGTTAAVAIPMLPETLPMAASDFPTSSLELTGSASTPVTIPPSPLGSPLYIGQLTTIQFDKLENRETIRIELPDNTSLTPGSANVPEPGSLILWALGSLLPAAIGWFRRSGGRYWAKAEGRD